MATKEISVEQYLIDEVERTGGETRKVRWVGRRGAPDRLCGWPTGRHAYVEVKLDTQGWGDQAHQFRERERMRSWGMPVPQPLWNRDQVDAFVLEMTS